MSLRSLFLSLMALPVIACTQNQSASNPATTEAVQAAKSQPEVRWILLSSNLTAVENSINKLNGRIEHRMTHFSGLVAHLPEAAISQLTKSHSDLKAVPDIEMKVPRYDEVAATGRPSGGGTTQPPQQIPWGLTTIRARDAHTTYRGTGIKVCVVDTGIDKTHPDLAANIVGGRNFVAIKGGVSADGWNDDNGHGSHVAGTIAALDNSIGAVGVAPDAKLYGVKVLDKRGSGYMSAVADGVMECLAAGAKVINMSLGGSGDPTLDSPLKTAVEAAANAGVKVVVAAGNEGVDSRTTVPAGYPQVLAVAAVDSAGVIPNWSNFGLSQKDLTAPGVSVYSTWKSAGYNTISGTSMASPHIAGVMALIIEASSLGPVGVPMGYSVSREGAGLVDALLSVGNL